MIHGLGLPGASEFVVIVVVGVLLIGIFLTTWAIARAKRKRDGGE
jgi:hypothetical protein